MSLVWRAVIVLAIAAALALVLALLLSNYSLTPNPAKAALLMVAAIIAGALVNLAWQLARDIFRRRQLR